MPDVVIPAPALAAHGLPHLGICPRHGGRPTRTSNRTFYTRPPAWSYVLILVGLLVFLLVVLSTRKQVAGPFPECQDCSRDRRRFFTWVGAAWGVTLLGFVLAVATNSQGLAGLTALLAVAALIVSMLRDRFRVSGWLSNDQAWLTLKRVDPAFAQASNAAQQAALAAQQAYAPPPPPSYPPPAVTPRW